MHSFHALSVAVPDDLFAFVYQNIKKKIVTEGQLLFTGPMIDHAMLYTKETEILVVSKNPRDQKTYEEDTVRIDFMDDSKRF